MFAGQSIKPAFDPVLVVGHYPAPIAHAYASLGDASSALDRLFALRDTFEVTLKYCAIVMLQDYLRLGLKSVPVDSAITQYLQRPQLGNWNHILREVARFCQSERERVVVPELIDFYFEPWGTPRRRGHELVNSLINFRNKVIAHRARPREKEADQVFDSTRPLLEELLADLTFLSKYKVASCKDASTLEIHMGAATPVMQSKQHTELSPGQVYVMSEDRVLSLYPLLIYDVCDQTKSVPGCHLTKFFFYNGGDRRPEYLDYMMGHVKQIVPVTERLQEIISNCRSRLSLELQQEPSAISSDLMREAVSGFVGRRSEESRVLDFVLKEHRGRITVVGDPGIGKSSFLSRIVLDLSDDVEAAERSAEIAEVCAALRHGGIAVAFHVCTRRVPESTSVPTILSSLTSQLVKHYGPPATIPQERSWRTLLDVARLAHSHFAGKALIVIDGIDEALYGRSAREQADILRELPISGHLPEGVFALIASRRGYLETEAAGSLQIELAGLETVDVRQILAEVSDRFELRERHVEAVERVSQNNSLYVRMLVNDLKAGKIAIDQIERLPHGLEGYFEDFIRRLCVDSSWPALRDCLLVLAVARSHLSVNQVCAITDLTWAEVEEAMEDKLQSVLVPLSADINDYQLFHEKFREFLLTLFSGRSGTDVVTRLNKHFVREAPRELRAEGEVTAPVHLANARSKLVEYCRRWRELDDSYPLMHLPRHLAETGYVDELHSLLLKTEFVEKKLGKFEDSFLIAEDFRYLTTVLLEAGRTNEIEVIAVTEHGYVRDGIASALRTAPPDESSRVKKILLNLLARNTVRETLLGTVWASLGSLLPMRREIPAALINARRVALEVAYHLSCEDVLLRASQDESETVRTMLVPYLYRYWRKDRSAGWKLLDRLSDALLNRLGLPSHHAVYGGMCLAILIYHSGEAEVVGKLRHHWRSSVRRILHLPAGASAQRTFLLRSGLRFVIFALTRNLRLLMAAQPDFQPINLREMAASYRNPGPEQQLGLLVLEHLEHPDLGYRRPLEEIVASHPPFGLYLMMVLERMLVFHGARDPEGVMAQLFVAHQQGPVWFRQSALYVSFHTLYKSDDVPDHLLQLHARMTRETISAGGATFTSSKKVYDLIPHMAWAELIFEKHSPRGHAQFIPEFFAQAKAQGSEDFARRAIEAGVVLSVAYGRHDLALDALRTALTERDPKLRAILIEALANIRFQAEDVVDRFLEREHARELSRLVQSTTPTLKANDIFGWIDEYMNFAMIHSPEFRAEIVGAFSRAGHARSLAELLQQILKWVINVSTGEPLLPLSN